MTAARKIKVLILVALVLSIGAGVGFMIVRSHLMSNPELLLDQVAKHVDLSLKNVDYTQITDGRKEWTLKATQIDYEQSQDQFALEDIDVTLYRTEGGSVRMTGKTGVFNRKENWVTVKQKVRIITEEGYSVWGDSFRFDLQNRILTGQGRVHLTGPWFQIAGTDMRFSVTEKLMVLEKDVETKIFRAGDEKGV